MIGGCDFDGRYKDPTFRGPGTSTLKVGQVGGILVLESLQREVLPVRLGEVVSDDIGRERSVPCETKEGKDFFLEGSEKRSNKFLCTNTNIPVSFVQERKGEGLSSTESSLF